MSTRWSTESGWPRLRSTRSLATLNITFSTRLWNWCVGGGCADLSVLQTRREAACRFRSNYPSAHYGHYCEKKTFLRATSCKAKSATELRPDGACGVEADSLRHRLTPHRNSKKSAAHSPYENQRSIAAMTAATRRGEFFVTIRDKLSAILSNLSKLSLFGVSPAEVVFMRV